jgi:hypothetical protein
MEKRKPTLKMRFSDVDVGSLISSSALREETACLNETLLGYLPPSAHNVTSQKMNNDWKTQFSEHEPS